MTYTKQVTLWCDFCGEWKQMSTGSVTEARKDAKKAGWTSRKSAEHFRVRQDVCPKCVQEEKHEQ
jgi:hypothetical protein